jgi:hypothetical protein
MFIIMGGQQITGKAADKRALQTYLDAEVILDSQTHPNPPRRPGPGHTHARRPQRLHRRPDTQLSHSRLRAPAARAHLGPVSSSASDPARPGATAASRRHRVRRSQPRHRVLCGASSASSSTMSSSAMRRSVTPRRRRHRARSGRVAAASRRGDLSGRSGAGSPGRALRMSS